MDILKWLGVVLLALGLLWVVLTTGIWPAVAVGVFGGFAAWFVFRK